MFPPTTTQIPGCKIPVTATHCPVAGGIPRARLSEGRGFPGPGRAGSAAALPTPGLPHVHPCTISFPCIPVSCTGSSACFTIWLIFLKTCHQGRQQPLGVLPPRHRRRREMLRQHPCPGRLGAGTSVHHAGCGGAKMRPEALT